MSGLWSVEYEKMLQTLSMSLVKPSSGYIVPLVLSNSYQVGGATILGRAEHRIVQRIIHNNDKPIPSRKAPIVHHDSAYEAGTRRAVDLWSRVRQVCVTPLCSASTWRLTL